VPRCGPHFELRIAGRADLQQDVVPAIVEFNGGDRLLVAAIESFGEAENRSERADRPAATAAEIAEQLVPLLGRRLTMVARDERDRVHFLGIEAAQVAVPDEIAGMFVVPLVADVDADVVQ